MKILRDLVQNVVGRRASSPRGKEGSRAYAVGDIHGRLDLLDDLLLRIEADLASRPEKRTFIVFLGDLIDRGPASAGVVERLRTYAPAHIKPVFLCGNHEEIFLRILRGDATILRDWLKFGGSECAESYGISPEVLADLDREAAIRLIQSKVPPSHTEFLQSFGDTFLFGDYLFVHAGIRPGLHLQEQDLADLRWIRDPFLQDDRNHGFVVVHGHTIVKEVEERDNRIGIDTGAYHSGVLTALAIEDESRWYLSTGATAT